MRRVLPIVAFLFTGVVATAIVLWQQPPAPAPKPPAKPATGLPNIVMVVIDTQRTDAMSLYGSEWRTTKRIDAWAEDALVFEHAWAQGAYTLSSYVSYMTSTHVRTHGLDGGMGPGGLCTWTDLRFVPEVLGEYGFRSTALVSNTNLYPKKGFPRGFDTWNELTPEQLGTNTLTKAQVRWSDERVVRAAHAEVAGWKEGERNFLYVHVMGPHLPLRPSPQARAATGVEAQVPKNIGLPKIKKWRQQSTAEQRDWTSQLYRAAVWDTDKLVGPLLEQLAAQHADDTAVFLFSDHGEQIWEHDSYGHKGGVWEQLVRVPLVLKAPGVAPGRHSRQVALLDLLPTVLELAGIDATDPSWQGHSLLHDNDRKAVFAQRFNEMAATTDGATKAVWTWDDEPDRSDESNQWSDKGFRKRWRDVVRARGGYQDGMDLYDLRTDPTEQVRRADDPVGFDALYADWLASTPVNIRDPDAPAVGICGEMRGKEKSDQTQALRLLGYVE